MTIFKACDIRGTFEVDLFPDHAHKLGMAVAALLGPAQVIVGGDGRVSTPQLKNVLIDSLAVHGCDVIDVGMLPTPAFYFARKFLAVNPGIMVTASHNPAGDNGFKIVLGELPVTGEDLQRIQTLMTSPPRLPVHPAGKVFQREVLDEYFHERQRAAPDLTGLQVVIDCSDGMASLAAKEIWSATGARIHLINHVVDGSFPHHPPNPAKPENLQQLIETVKRVQADMGCAFDGDADRVGFVDPLGVPLDQDKAIALFSRELLRTSGPAAIVFDQKCSRLVPETIVDAGGKPLREKSGHTFIKTTFIEHAAPYAGELSGHHFFREVGGDDAIFASIEMGRIVVQSGKTLAALAAEIKTYPITPDLRIPMQPETVARVLADLQANLVGRGDISTVDGFRIELENAWGMARKSVTEPVITMRFEGRDQQALQKIIERFIEAAPDLSGKIRPEGW
jgi:phosphomannomutase/phosphoglucomutase